METASLKMPKISTKNIWFGIYGGHYDCITFFDRKPKKSKEDYNLIDVIKGKYYDLLENKQKIVGTMYLSEFEELYPDFDLSFHLVEGNGGMRPKAIEIIEVFQLKLQAYWDEGKMRTINFDCEGWN
jgi:hypothetical protein